MRQVTKFLGRIASVLTVVVVSMSIARPATASLITDHALVSGSARGFGSPTGVYNNQGAMVISDATGFSFGDLYGFSRSSGSSFSAYSRLGAQTSAMAVTVGGVHSHNAEASVGAAWVDYVTLSNLTSASTLRFNYGIHATSNVAVTDPLQGGVAYSRLRFLASAAAGIDVASGEGDRQFCIDANNPCMFLDNGGFTSQTIFTALTAPGLLDIKLDATLSIDVQVDSTHNLVLWGANLEAGSGILTDGFASMNAAHTAELESILVLDPVLGFVTPESLGIALVFDSGIPSPNMPDPSAVPEPASLVLLMSGALLVAGYSWRQGRGQWPCEPTTGGETEVGGDESCLLPKHPGV